MKKKISIGLLSVLIFNGACSILETSKILALTEVPQMINEKVNNEEGNSLLTESTHNNQEENLNNEAQFPSGESTGLSPLEKVEETTSNETLEQNQENKSVTEDSSDRVKANTLSGTEKSGTTTNINGWEVVDEGTYFLITKYTGFDTDIVVPPILNGKITKLATIDKNVFPNYGNITSFKILPSASGVKVGLKDRCNQLGDFFGYTFDGTWAKLNTIDLSGLDTSQLLTTANMFKGCIASRIDLNGWDVSKVRNMSSMFEGCNSLVDLDISSFNTSNVTNMSRMFSNCGRLKNLDISHFDTRNVTDMSVMFANCLGLRQLDLSNFNTAQVKDMTHMFNNCLNLTDLKLTNFDTSNVTEMNNMFWGTPRLQKLDLSSFKISASCRAAAMFPTGSGTPLTVIATDPYFFSYNYSADNRTFGQLLLNANGGSFSDGNTEKNYFTSCAVRPEAVTLDKVEEFKQSNIPTKDGFRFDGYTPTTDVSQATNALDLIGTVFNAQWKIRTISFEVPTTISFGTHKLSKGTNYYSVDTLEGNKLSVTDERGKGSEWQLTAKLQAPLTNSGKILPNSLVYKTSASEETLTDSAAQIIATHTTTTDTEQTFISDNWNSTQGLMLKIEEGKASMGEYSGTIEWTLNDTP